jgi:hypothetical protein
LPALHLKPLPESPKRDQKTSQILAEPGEAPEGATPEGDDPLASLQPLFGPRLGAREAASVWQALLASLRQKDLLSDQQLRSPNLNPSSSSSFLRSPPTVGEAKERLLFFFKSLPQFHTRRHTLGLADHLPTLLTMRSLTILVPVYSETVTITMQSSRC